MLHKRYTSKKYWFVCGLCWVPLSCHPFKSRSKDLDQTSEVKVGPEGQSSVIGNINRVLSRNASASVSLGKTPRRITTDESSFFLTSDHAISLVITPDEQNQSVTCTIVDCTTTVIKPIKISSGQLNFFIGTATITTTYEKTSQRGLINGQQVDESHAKSSFGSVATFAPIAFGNILNIGITLNTNVDRIKLPEKPKGKFENLNCQIQFGCRIPSLYFYIGANFKGLQIGAEIAPSLTADDQASISTEVATYKGHIDYLHIPEAIIVNLLNAAESLVSPKTTIPPGRFVDNDWNEFVDYYRNATHTPRRSPSCDPPASATE